MKLTIASLLEKKVIELVENLTLDAKEPNQYIFSSGFDSYTMTLSEDGASVILTFLVDGKEIVVTVNNLANLIQNNIEGEDEPTALIINKNLEEKFVDEIVNNENFNGSQIIDNLQKLLQDIPVDAQGQEFDNLIVANDIGTLLGALEASAAGAEAPVTGTDNSNTFTDTNVTDVGVTGTDVGINLIGELSTIPVDVGQTVEETLIAAPTASIVISDAGNVTESSSAFLNFAISLSNPVDNDVTIDGLNLGGSATQSVDYSTLQYELSDGTWADITNGFVLPADGTAVNVRVPVMDDTIYEGSESITVQAITTDPQVSSVEDIGSGNILDINDTPTLNVTGEKVSEGDYANFTVTLSNATEADLNVNLTPSIQIGDTAETTDIDPNDMVVTYVDPTDATNTITIAVNQDGTYTIPAGVTEIDVAVRTTQDTVYEGDETFTLTASSILTGSASGQSIIADDGTGIPDVPTDTPDNDKPTLNVTGEKVSEGDYANFTVTLSNATEADLNVNLTPSIQIGDTAETTDIDPNDMVVTYVDPTDATNTITIAVNQDGTYTIPAGVTEIDVAVRTTQDTVYEGDETFTLTASSILTGSASGQSIIADDGTGIPDVPTDTPDNDKPTLNVTGEKVSEGDYANFTVTLSNATEADLNVNLTPSIQIGDTAETTDIDPNDMVVTYVDPTDATNTITIAVNQDGTYTIPAGVTEIDVAVRTTQDTVYEGDETFTLTASSILTGSASGQSIIADDGTGIPDVPTDTPDNDTPTLNVTGEKVSEGDYANFTVTLSNATEADLNVNLTPSIQIGDTAETTDIDPNDMVVTYVDPTDATNTITIAVNQDGTYTIPAGVTEIDVAVRTTQDTVYEGDETFTLTASSILTGSASGQSIIADDGTGIPDVPTDTPDNDKPTLNVTGEKVSEGDYANFTVTLSNATEADLNVNLTPSIQIGDTAETTDIDPNDMVVTYVDPTDATNTITIAVNQDGTYTIPAGVTEIDVAVRTTQDTVYEGDETFTLTASSILTGSASGQSIIADDGTGIPDVPTDTPDNDKPTLNVTGEKVSEGDYANFTVTLSNATEADLNVNLTPSIQIGDTAETTDIDPNDMVVTYVDPTDATNTITIAVNQDGTYTIPAGVTEIDVAVRTTQDTVYEGDETFTLTASSILTGSASGQSIIADDGTGIPDVPTDTPDNDKPTLNVTGEKVSEGDYANFTVTLSNATEADLNVNLTPSIQIGDTAETTDIDPNDMVVTYVDPTDATNTITIAVNQDGTYTIPAGVTEIDVAVRTTQDTVYEGDETFTLTASSILTGSASGQSIIADDGTGIPDVPTDTPDNDTPTLNVTGEKVSEGDYANFTVTLSNATEADLNVNLTPSIQIGDTAETTDIDPNDMVVTYVDPTDATNTITIAVNQDGTYTIPAGVTEIDVAVRTTQDTVYEGDETFTLTASSILTGSASGQSIIADDGTGIPDVPTDTPDNDKPTLNVTGEKVSEGDYANFTVTLSNATEADLNVNLTPSIQIGDTAETTDIDPNDMVVTYVDPTDATNTITIAVNQDGTYTIPAGVTEIDVAVRTTQDTVYEGDETFTLTASSILTGSASGQSIIADDGTGIPDVPTDTPDNDTPTLNVTGEKVSEGDYANFTVTLSNATEADLNVNLTPSIQIGDTAETTDIDPNDMVVTYVDPTDATNTITIAVNQDGTYTIPAGVTEIDVAVRTTQDTVYEGDETFTLTASSILTGSASGQSIIADDEKYSYEVTKDLIQVNESGLVKNDGSNISNINDPKTFKIESNSETGIETIAIKSEFTYTLVDNGTEIDNNTLWESNTSNNPFILLFNKDLKIDLANKDLIIDTGFGYLKIESYDSISGEFTYSYELHTAMDHSDDSILTQDIDETEILKDFLDLIILDSGEENTVTLSVSVVDHTSTVVADTLTTNVGATVNIGIDKGVLANDDSGADGWAENGAVVGVQIGNTNSNDLEDSNTIGTEITGTYGKLTMNADGSYSYEVTADTIGDDAEDVFTYTVKDGDGDLATTTLTINVNAALEARVSEEGLDSGIKDNDDYDNDNSTSFDTTDNKFIEGTLVTGLDNTSISFTAPTNSLTSGGDTIHWIGSNTSTLVGYTATNFGLLAISTAANVALGGIATITLTADASGLQILENGVWIDATAKKVITNDDFANGNVRLSPNSDLNSIVNIKATVTVNPGITEFNSAIDLDISIEDLTKIIEISADNQGEYTVELFGPVDHPTNSIEDELSFDVGFTATDGTNSSSNTLKVTIEDDMPQADVEINVNANINLDTTNIDVSSSINDLLSLNDSLEVGNGLISNTITLDLKDIIANNLGLFGADGAGSIELIPSNGLTASIDANILSIVQANILETAINGVISLPIYLVDADGDKSAVTLKVNVLANVSDPDFTVSSPSVDEGDIATFDIKVAPSPVSTNIKLSLNDGTAKVEDSDYENKNNLELKYTKDGLDVEISPNDDGSYTIPAFVTDLKVEVQTNDDTTYEGDEEFKLEVTIGDTTKEGIATITDNDSSISAVDEVQNIDYNTLTTTNLVITLDLSGSMGFDNNKNLEAAKSGLKALIDKYGVNTNVKLVTFGNKGSSEKWMTAEEAKSEINKLSANMKYTNYEAAIKTTVDNYSDDNLDNKFTDTNNDGVPDADNTVVYFISDGTPTAEYKDNTTNVYSDDDNNPGDEPYTNDGSTFVDQAYIDQWNTFVSDKELFVLGLATEASKYLIDIAEKGILTANISVGDFDTKILNLTVPKTITGNLLTINNNTDSSDDIDTTTGEQDGYVTDSSSNNSVSLVSIKIGTTIYDFSNQTELTNGITTLSGAILKVDLSDGSYTYTAKDSGFSGDTKETFEIVASNGVDTVNYNLIINNDVNEKPIAIINKDGNSLLNIVDINLAGTIVLESDQAFAVYDKNDNVKTVTVSSSEINVSLPCLRTLTGNYDVSFDGNNLDNKLFEYDSINNTVTHTDTNTVFSIENVSDNELKITANDSEGVSDELFNQVLTAVQIDKDDNLTNLIEILTKDNIKDNIDVDILPTVSLSVVDALGASDEESDTLLLDSSGLPNGTDGTVLASLELTGTDIDLTSAINKNIAIDEINLENNSPADTLNIDLSDIVDLTDDTNELVIKGDNGDIINLLDTEWNANSTENKTIDGKEYDCYQGTGDSSTVKIFIEKDIQVNEI